MPPLPPNPLNLGGAPPADLAPKGKLALPPNPIGAALVSAPKVAPAPSRVVAHGAIPALAAATEKASAKGNAAYNKKSGGTQGVVPGMNPSDLKALRVAAKKYPAQSDLAGSLGNPIEWGVQAVQGAKQIKQGAEKAIKGNLGGGAAEAGLGALSVAGVLPFGKVGEAIGIAAKAGRTAEEAQAHLLEVAAKAKAEGFGKTAADVLVPPTAHDPVPPHVSTDHEYPGGFVDNARTGLGYAYHRTSAEAFPKVAKEGLKANTPVGKTSGIADIKGVYFSADPLTATRFANRGADSVYLRARQDAIPDLGLHPNKAYGEMITPHNVPPQNLEYLGADGVWHPVGEQGLTATERAAQVREALQGAPEARGAQNILQSAERGKRFAASAAAAQQHEGVAAYHAAVGQLRGKLPQINYKGFSQLDGQTLNTLLEDIKNHPSLMQGQKITAQRSLLRAVGEGKAPTVGEEKILRSVFGNDVTEQIKGSAGFFKTYKNLALDAANIPRAIMSSADLSAPLRQGLVAMTTHPVISLKAFPQMIKMFGSERLYQASRSAIENDPLFPLAMKAELPLTGIGTKEGATSLVGREEAYQSNLAERLNVREIKFLHGLGKFGTGPGDLIRASDRAYAGYLNQVRFDVFKSLVHDAAMNTRDGAPLDLNNTKLIKDIARFVGSATGRGPLGPLKNHAVSINALFFSPKLLASRLDILLSPATYLHADPFVRRQALQATFALVGTMSLVLYLAKLGGAEVGLDPTSADFAKIKIGNTRIDIAGGFQQPVRLAFQLAEGKITSSTTGKSMALSGGIGKTSAGDVALRFIFNKAAPVPGFALQASGVSQATFGPKQALWKQAIQRLIPLLAQDANDLRQTPGAFGGNPSVGKAVAGYGLGLFGVGEQTYAPRQPKNGSSGGWGSGGSGGSSGGWGGSSGGSSSGGWGG